MGNTPSTLGQSTSHVFETELKKLNVIVNDIVNEKNVFNNQHYNFLSEDVCSNYQVVLEEELTKHLKLDIKSLGTSLYIIPKNDADVNVRLTKHNLTKKQVCEKIGNHYIKILYILCLIKYVYNLESNGDLSIAGIIFRNIKLMDDMMQIQFCALPHKRYTNTGKDAYKIDLSKLEGLQFFADYFLSPEESYTFLGIIRSILARSSPALVKRRMCNYIDKHGITDLPTLEGLYASRYKNSKLTCQKGGANLHIFIEKDNPIFQSDYCGAPMKLVVKLGTPEGKKIYESYKHMYNNYTKSISDIQKIMDRLIYKNSNGQFELKDVDKQELDGIVNEVKLKIKVFYIQSIFDFQNLLDMAKSTPKIHIT